MNFPSLAELNPIPQAFVATVFTWLLTAIGAASVFLTKEVNRKVLDGMLGFAAGVMLAASFFSLLLPALDLASLQNNNMPPWLPVAVGFSLGGTSIRIADRIIPHLHVNIPPDSVAEGPKTNLQRSILLVIAITIHNIPEGMAIGIAFGAAPLGIPGATLGAAISLAIGIGLQNFPEGMAVSMPLRREGLTRLKSFWYGQLSAVVEPVAAVSGAAFVYLAQPFLPYALSFATGAMIFVVAEEVIPESQRGGNGDMATLCLLAGFVIMMVLDTALG
ncbi:MAG: ZIP family metal transporter [Candidatus Nitrosocosmicus sp.]